MIDNKKLLGIRIKELRKHRGLTQEKLAELIGIETGSLSAIESGRHYPSLTTVEKISSILNMEMKKFFDFNHNKPKEEKIIYIKNSLSELPEELINIVYTMINK